MAVAVLIWRWLGRYSDPLVYANSLRNEPTSGIIVEIESLVQRATIRKFYKTLKINDTIVLIYLLCFVKVV